jgi:hypothetical protein
MSATPAAIHKHESRVIAWHSCIGDESIQSYLCIGGNHDGLNYPAHAGAETIEWPIGITGRETYKRSTLSVGDVSIMIYIQESMTPEQTLNRLVEHYRAWCVNRPGGRL